MNLLAKKLHQEHFQSLYFWVIETLTIKYLNNLLEF